MLIRALKVTQVSAGVYSLKLPRREVSSAENQVLNELFPHLGHCVHDLLDKEALLDAVIGPECQDDIDITEAEIIEQRKQEVKKKLAELAAKKAKSNDVLDVYPNE